MNNAFRKCTAPLPGPLPSGERGTFSTAARKLSGQAGAVLHWSPDAFWAATPDELATVFEALAGDRPAPVDVKTLMELFPDG